MNNERRKAITAVLEELRGDHLSVIEARHAEALEAVKKYNEAIDGFIEAAKEGIEPLIEEEQEAYDNLTEGLQQAERGEKMQEGISDLESAVSSIDELDEPDFPSEVPNDFNAFFESVEEVLNR